MKIVVYEGREPEYVPDILFKDGTYKDAAAYIRSRRAMDKKLAGNKVMVRSSNTGQFVKTPRKRQGK